MPPNASDLHLSEAVPAATTESESETDLSTDTSAEETLPAGIVLTTTGERRPPRHVLLTGGAGFIGSHVAAALLARGDFVTIVDEFNDYYDPAIKNKNVSALIQDYGSRVRVIAADICDADAMSSIFACPHSPSSSPSSSSSSADTTATNTPFSSPPTLVVHLAARAGVRDSIKDPMLYIHSNVEGTTKLLELAAKNGHVENFVYASSSSVYGGSKLALFSEDDIVDKPVSPYAATKKMCELMAHTYHHLYGLNTTGLRFFTVYGPAGRPDMAAFKFIHRIANGVAIERYGDGSSERDWTYVGDIVDGVVRSLDRQVGCEVFNLGNGDPIQLRSFISEVERQLGTKATIIEKPDQPGDVSRTCANISKAQRMLGYQPKVKLREGLARTIAWYRGEDFSGSDGRGGRSAVPFAAADAKAACVALRPSPSSLAPILVRK